MNVLFCCPPRRGHATRNIAIAAELSSRGHYIEFVSYEEARQWIPDSIRFVSAGPTPEEHESLYFTMYKDFTWRSNYEYIQQSFKNPSDFVGENWQHYITNLLVAAAKRIRSQEHSWDLIVLDDHWCNLGKALADEQGIPTAFVASFCLGTKVDLVIRPLLALRLYLTSSLSLARVFKLKKTSQKQIKKRLGITHDNTDQAIEPIYLIPTVPEVIKGVRIPSSSHCIGSMISPEIGMEKDDNLEAWMQKGPFIYINFGTLVYSEAEIKICIEAFRHCPWRALIVNFSMDFSTVTHVSENILVLKYVPQQQVLQHANIKLFISHGGPNSFHESLYFGIPMLSIPFLGDQYYFAESVQKKGFGLMMERHTLTGKRILHAVDKISKDQHILSRCQSMAKILRKEDSLDRAAQVLESVKPEAVS
ncbi:glycosyltransferase [Spartinivicinus poritis]|uniref:Glycosyltransferase n=1 Tax=Spartinivicinus poritis TaxID=2994640 RepID=A0ABT5U8Q5_9GAMM|nr:glycosyltransferase [Spartinivicinus sp. A2-2]MDE1462570.1 glycosyltransferase [Spartinivicinus sp. A2-2]